MMSDAVDAEEVTPFTFNLGAMRFLQDADDLFRIRQSDVLHPTQEPVYVLYAHAVELVLKAYLRAAGVPTATLVKTFGHDVGELYDDAIRRGLDPLPEHAPHFDVVLHLTTESNRDQTLRYWTSATTRAPEITWLRKVAHYLVDHVAARLSAMLPSLGKQSSLRKSEMFGPRQFGLPDLPEPPYRSAGPVQRWTVPDQSDKGNAEKAKT